MANMKNLVNEQTMSVSSIDDAGKKNVVKPGKTKIQLIEQTGVACPQEEQDFEQPGCPSKFLMMCLNSIQNTLQHDGFISNEDDKPLFSDSWGIEFWKCYSIGKDILETSGTCSTIKQIAWMAATATDNIARKDKEGLSMTSPFLLFLVPSQEKAIEVRSACKPLKAHGIHTVSLHPGASIDHQVLGLKSCEPEFLVSTPERLLELASLKAIDISGVSLLVVDGLDMFIKDGHVDIVNSIKQSISLSPQTVVFSDSLTNASRTVVQNILGQSICRLSLNNSIASQGACIVQSVHICAFREEKLLKGIEILDQACGDWLHQQSSKVLFIGGKDCNFAKLVPAINSKGYFVSTNSDYCNSVVENSESRPEVSIIDAKCISTTDLEEFEIVICSDLGHSIDNYIQILTRMARYTVSGVLHSFLTAEDAMLMGPLVEILEKCGQEVPEALRNLCHSTQVPEH
ncbi:RNA helicase [Bertholletia excelsa]